MLGCGAGLDVLLLARRMSGCGTVIALDFSWAMLQSASRISAARGTGNVLFCQADAGHLPLDDGVIDVAVVNGIFNLNPARDAILREPLPPGAWTGQGNWFA